MKLSNRQLRGARLELSMTSMIDVVFLLLIFFLVTSTFIRPEREVASNIKVNENNAGAEASNLEPAVVDVFRQDSEVLFRVGAVRTRDLEAIKEVLESFDNKSDGAFVRAAGNVPYEAAAQAIAACHESGFSSVSYLPLD